MGELQQATLLHACGPRVGKKFVFVRQQTEKKLICHPCLDFYMF
jgi:hypothetical protein